MKDEYTKAVERERAAGRICVGIADSWGAERERIRQRTVQSRLVEDLAFTDHQAMIEGIHSSPLRHWRCWTCRRIQKPVPDSLARKDYPMKFLVRGLPACQGCARTVYPYMFHVEHKELPPSTD